MLATDAAVPATDAVPLSSSRRTAFSRVLRGGGSSSRNGIGSEMEEKASSPPQKQDAAMEPACSQPGGDPTKGAVGEEPGTDSVTAKPAAAAAAAPAPATSTAVKQEPKGDAQEQALREALLSADGPAKILREVERIPALRRLSDSALRVTSATPSDGRLAALALYRLGAAARAAET
ncbi:unnamed protein product, partial [Ectocarpus fasciculatus]